MNYRFVILDSPVPGILARAGIYELINYIIPKGILIDYFATDFYKHFIPSGFLMPSFCHSGLALSLHTGESRNLFILTIMVYTPNYLTSLCPSSEITNQYTFVISPSGCFNIWKCR
jgi:hypothetical protein